MLTSVAFLLAVVDALHGRLRLVRLPFCTTSSPADRQTEERLPSSRICVSPGQRWPRVDGGVRTGGPILACLVNLFGLPVAVVRVFMLTNDSAEIWHVTEGQGHVMGVLRSGSGVQDGRALLLSRVGP